MTTETQKIRLFPEKRPFSAILLVVFGNLTVYTGFKPNLIVKHGFRWPFYPSEFKKSSLGLEKFSEKTPLSPTEVSDRGEP